METNKLLASVLVAGIIAMMAGFIAKELTETPPLAKDAYTIAAPTQATAVATAVKLLPFKDYMAKADAAKGAQTAQVCGSCHVFTKGGGNGIGPNLFGVVGSKLADVAGYAFSDAMKAKGGSWTPERLNDWLTDPQKFVPGTKMTFTGLPDPQDRADVIKYLQSLK
ncbi:MAG: cytochrome c family protein [Alphaproteobacteria bacterium]|nr:cytochrome c family protein [Alphaproteobacteria bacterium]MDE2337458.1 cytochrome c family protein [Alphaproteobacteria bacterium]